MLTSRMALERALTGAASAETAGAFLSQLQTPVLANSEYTAGY